MPYHPARMAVLVALVLALSLPVAPAGAARDQAPMLTARVKAISGVVIAKWRNALGRTWATQPLADRVCTLRLGADCGLARWQSFVGNSRGLAGGEQLRRVQAYVNATSYREDRVIWGRSDYWAAPGEFFARGGDCEDYAIAKYLSLRQLGFEPRDMRVLVLRDTLRGRLHAVLLVQYRGETLVLDNLRTRILRWDELPQYRPIYSVNEIDFWLHDSGAAA